MDLPVNPPVLPMLAKLVDELPPGDDWIFEPKWDGFRTLVFRDGEELFIQSRDEKPLARYFPELVPVLLAQLPDRCVLDGEIVIVGKSGLDFDALQMRLHPAESRVRMLAREIPASIVFFDILALGDVDLRGVPFSDRRAALEEVLADVKAPLHLTPATRDRAVAAMINDSPAIQAYLRRAYVEPADGTDGVLERLTDLTAEEVRALRAAGLASTDRSLQEQVAIVVVRQLGDFLLQPLADRVWSRAGGRATPPQVTTRLTLPPKSA